MLAYQPALLESPPPWEETLNTLSKERGKNFESLLTYYLGKTFSLDCVIQLPPLYSWELPGAIVCCLVNMLARP